MRLLVDDAYADMPRPIVVRSAVFAHARRGILDSVQHHVSVSFNSLRPTSELSRVFDALFELSPTCIEIYMPTVLLPLCMRTMITALRCGEGMVGIYGW